MLKQIILGLTLLISCLSLSAQETTEQETASQETASQETASQETASQETASQETAPPKTVDQDKDRQYVTDQLRLSLYTQSNSSSQVVKLLQSGDLLEIEQIKGPYAFVTTPDGTKGWVKRGFLVTKPTSNILLLEEQKKTASLTAEIEKLANSKVVIDQYEQDMDKLVEQVAILESEKQQANQSLAEMEQELEAKQLELDRKDEDSAPALLVLSDTFRKYWQIVVPIIIVIILLSYLVSKKIVETRIKSRFHGIKIW